MLISSLSHEISVSYPSWFFKVIPALYQGKKTVTLEFQKGAALTPSGIALLEMVRREAETLGVALRGLPKLPEAFPIHHKDFSIAWCKGALDPSFMDRFVECQALSKRGPLHPDLEFDLRLLFSELSQNAMDHSTSERYLVLLSRKEVGVFDLGVGLLAKLQQKYPVQSDIQAIELSLKEGITTRRLRPGGYGLHHAVKLARRNMGYLYIASGTGQYRASFKDKKIARKTMRERFPGTIVYCALANALPNLRGKRS